MLKYSSLSILVVILLLVCNTNTAQSWTADNGNGTYTNLLFFDGGVWFIFPGNAVQNISSNK